MKSFWRSFWYTIEGASMSYGGDGGYWKFNRRRLWDVITVIAIILLAVGYFI